MGFGFFRPGAEQAPKYPHSRPLDEHPSALEDRLPEVPVDEELVRSRRIETAMAFLSSDAGRPYRDIVDAVSDFGPGGVDWYLTATEDVKGWQGTSPSNPALDLRQQIMHMRTDYEAAAGKAFELTFPPPTKEQTAAMWQSYAAWKKDKSNLANGVALPGDWAVDEQNPFQEALFGRPLYTVQDFERLRQEINSGFKTRDQHDCIPSKRRFVDWCLDAHEGRSGTSSRMLAHQIHSIQPAHQIQVGTFRDSKFQEGRVERFDSTAPMLTSKIDSLLGGVARIEIVANIFKATLTDARVKRMGADEVIHVYGENAKVHFRIGSVEAYWQGTSGSYFYFPIERAESWKARGAWELRERGSGVVQKITFGEVAGEQFEHVDYLVAVPWLRQLINTQALPMGFLAHFMVHTLEKFPNPWDLSWKAELAGLQYVRLFKPHLVRGTDLGCFGRYMGYT